jgi:hypothetical protein
MKFKMLHFFLSCFSFFAFAKISFAAVPIQAKSLKIEIAQDSILLDESGYLMQEEDARVEIKTLLRRARRLSNFAFAMIPLFFAAIFLESGSFFELTIIVASMPVLLGFVLSVLALGRLIKARKILDEFPVLETDEKIQDNWGKSLVRSIVANGIFTGLIVLILLVLQIDVFENSVNLTTFLAGLGLTLFTIFDKKLFNTKNKINK